MKKKVAINSKCGILFSVMSEKDKHIDWMNEQDDNAAYIRAAKEADFASQVEEDDRDEYPSPTHEDCGWFGYEGLCED